MRRASALILALWTIAVLSVMVLSFAYEARQQTGINFYVQNRNRAVHLIDAGKILAEIILLDYKNVAEWSEDQDNDKMLEDDAWFREKQDLKTSSKCTIGPVYLDEENPEDSLVTITIQSSNSGSRGIININELCETGDGSSDVNSNYRWWMIFKSHGIPEELTVPKEGKINLWNILIASWKDWRDSDDVLTQIDGEDCGAEDEWYEEKEDDYEGIDDDMKDEIRRRPRNGPIPDIKELSYVRGFRDYPAVLTGGVINPWDDEKEQITVRGIVDLFCTDGSAKINVNSCDSIDALITIPGIFDKDNIVDDGDECIEEAKEIAQAILDALGTIPKDRDVDESRSSWPFLDWNDMLTRVEDLSGIDVSSSDIGTEAQQYLSFTAENDTLFKVRILAEAGGMKRAAEAECYVNDNKIRYVKWVDNASTD